MSIFNIFKSKKKNGKEDKNEIGNQMVIDNAIQSETIKANLKYNKPESYTGNRHLYDDPSAKRNVKINSLAGNKTYRDPYTGEKLYLTKKEAKAIRGADYSKALAEGDHIKPIEKVFNEYKNDPWASNKDIKETVNSKENMQAVSRKFNNAKRSRDQAEFSSDDQYLKKTGVKLTKNGKEKAIQKSKEADSFIQKQMNQRKLENIINTGHEAGISVANSSMQFTAAASSITNIVAVVKGEKEPEDAIVDIVKDTGKSAASGYCMGNGLTVLNHSLSGSSSQFIKNLAANNVPAQIISAVIITGDTISKYADGEISTQECILELGEKGLNVATAGYSYAIGQALIPIPVIGGAIGALVGSIATSDLYNQIIETLSSKKLESEERQRLIHEANTLRNQLEEYREELIRYYEAYFQDCSECFSIAIDGIQTAMLNNDPDGVISHANSITRKLGGTVKYETVSEFKQFLQNNEIDEF